MPQDEVPREAAVSAAPQTQGLLLVLAPSPIALAASSDAIAGSWRLAAVVLSTLLFIIAATLIRKRADLARACAFGAMLAVLAAAIPSLVHSPQAALLAWIAAVSVAFAITRSPRRRPGPRAGRARFPGGHLRTRWAAASALALFVLIGLQATPPTRLIIAPLLASLGIVSAVALHWAWHAWRDRLASLRTYALAATAVLLAPSAAAAASTEWFHPVGIALTAVMLALTSVAPAGREPVSWWEPLLGHPARLLLTTFLGLCAIGTAALLLPGTTTSGSISFSSAAFTAVSATCVTGLIVLDTPNDFTLFGQACILVLIQLGGLGIMSISTVALHSLGRRLSLRQERILSSMHGDHEISLVESLRRVLRVTFFAEAAGAAILFTLFITSGDPWPDAAWRAVFTAVSAFCNAGFALQSDSLVGYAGQPLVLHVVAVLIVLGGMAPAVSVAFFRRRSGGTLDTTARIVLWMTAGLLAAGAVAVLTLEWSNTLGELSVADRLHNAWFQSVTLRTAGFNSIDIGSVSAPALLVMLVFMFIGGSPGGTAGGVKTTTIAVLGLAMWTSIAGRREVVTGRRWLPPALLYRAIAIVGSGILVWIVVVMALLITQPISERDVVFEATSALGTVGLSTGATAALDDVGRAIIIAAMFLGRVGPLTLFLLLGSDGAPAGIRYPEGRIPLT